MTTVASPTLVPELQAWFYNFVVNSEVNKFEVPAPVDVEDVYLPQKSFIEMLFNENYPYTEYSYLYNEETRLQCWPTLVRQRLCIYPGSAKYMLLADPGQSGDNIFGLQSADLTLLDALLGYRTDGTAVTIVDTTATIAFDSTALVLYANFDNLPTPLSKLIYLYLDLQTKIIIPPTCCKLGPILFENTISKPLSLILFSNTGLDTLYSPFFFKPATNDENSNSAKS